MDAFGGVAAFGRVIDKGASSASEMKRRGTVPVRYWPKLIRAARAAGITGVNAETLMRLHAPDAADVPTPANDTAPAASENAA